MTNSRLVVMALVAVLGAGCVLGVDVGSDSRPLAQGTVGADGGIFGPNTVDGGVACATTCAPVDGGPACAGDLRITSAQEWAVFEQLGCVHFNGNLTVSGTAAPIIAVEDHALQTVSGRVQIIANPMLTTVAFTELLTVGENLDVALNGAVTRVDLPKLTSSGGLNVLGATSLATLNAPVLGDVRGNLMFQDMALSTLNLPALTTVRGGNITVANNASLTAVQLPALATGGNSFGIRDNAALTDLALPALRTAPGFYVSNNPLLRQCLVDGVRLQLNAPVDYAASANNGTPNVCP